MARRGPSPRLRALAASGSLGAEPLRIASSLTQGSTVLDKRPDVVVGTRTTVSTKFYANDTGDVATPANVMMKVFHPDDRVVNVPMVRNNTTNVYAGAFVPLVSGMCTVRVSVPAPTELVLEETFYVKGRREA